MLLLMPVRCSSPFAGSAMPLPTALADLVDNSIAANAGEVAIHFEWAGPESWVRIVDDGEGMDDAALEAGMRLGARDPRAERAASDLGRFGLGSEDCEFLASSTADRRQSAQWRTGRLSALGSRPDRTRSRMPIGHFSRGLRRDQSICLSLLARWNTAPSSSGRSLTVS